MYYLKLQVTYHYQNEKYKYRRQESASQNIPSQFALCIYNTLIMYQQSMPLKYEIPAQIAWIIYQSPTNTDQCYLVLMICRIPLKYTRIMSLLDLKMLDHLSFSLALQQNQNSDISIISQIGRAHVLNSSHPSRSRMPSSA